MIRCGKRIRKATHALGEAYCENDSKRFFRVAANVRHVALRPYFARCHLHAEDLVVRSSAFIEVDED